MRIKYVIPSKPSPSCINMEMWQMLVHGLTVCDQIDIVDMSPDIVHIFGIWNIHNVRLVEQYRSKDIPVVFTSINGMLGIVNRNGRQVYTPNVLYAIRRIVRLGAVVHACGQTEQNFLTGIVKSSAIHVITNAAFTSTISVDDMVASFRSLYVDTIQSNDTSVRNRISRQLSKYNIQDKSIHDVCTRLMYIRQRFKMLNIPQSLLDETSQVLTESDYDEKSMRNTLDEMHLSKFASYTMALLESNSSLTEGFMPIDSIDGKVVSEMKNKSLTNIKAGYTKMAHIHPPKQQDMKYLHLLSQSFPNISEASMEIINLQAILHLPKGTEHFLADIHGEYEAFQHILKNASGNIQRKVDELFGNTMRESDMKELCTLIYYPDQKLELIKAVEPNIIDWYRITLHQLVSVCRLVASKYTHSKVRKSLPHDFSYIIQELLHERTDDANKADYVNVIIDTIISTGRADDFIVAISNVIQRLSIDQLHILGDIYDRGPGAHIILDTLASYHSWDIQWGNHDILWMGALAGNRACQCNVIRLSLRYANLATLEEGYGINLVPLATFAMETYGDDPCEEFVPKIASADSARIDQKTTRLAALMHKAITIIQFKEEAAIIKRNPAWNMSDRLLFNNIDYQKGTILLDGKEYELKSNSFPTIDPRHPDRLTPEEKQLMDKLNHSFQVSEKLHKHIRMLLQHGCMYAIYNNNLLFHASIPLNADGTLKEVEIAKDMKCSGKDLLYNIGMMIRTAFQSDSSIEERNYATDYFLYLWCGPDSPLFDKSKMATFERYFIADKATHNEEKGNYFKLRDNEQIVDNIMDAFGVTGENRHIINGHVPVHVCNGENPIKANGKLMVIDGGFSQAYHKETGIAGYTLVYHSRGFVLVQHEPFTSTLDAIQKCTDIKSTTQIVEMSAHRMRVADTDIGRELSKQINDLQQLLYAYRHGYVKEAMSNK